MCDTGFAGFFVTGRFVALLAVLVLRVQAFLVLIPIAWFCVCVCSVRVVFYAV